MRYDPKGRKQTDVARDHEIAQLRSVVGSLDWVARQCRPQVSYGVNKLQSVCGTATLDDLRFANKLLQEAKESSDDGLFFKSGLFIWNKMEMLTITDASFGNESNFRSQKGRMTFLTGPDSFDKNGMGVHLIGYSSTIIGRVCRSTLQAETYALSDGVEESMRLRAALADAHGVFLRTDWEYHTAPFMRNVWMIDCNSLNDHLRCESGCAYHGITDSVTNTLMKVQHVAVSENSVHNSCVPRTVIWTWRFVLSRQT